VNELFFWPFVSGALLSTLGCIWVIKNGQRWKIVDDPRTHRHPKVVHERAVPRGGGIPIFLALMSVFLFWGFEWKSIGIVLGGGLLMMVGYLDDRFEERLSPYLRLVLNGVAALLAVGAGVGIFYITNPLGGVINLSWPLSILFSLVWLVLMQNIIGWSSGVDGQMPGFVVIAALTMAAIGIKFGEDSSQVPLLILSGVTAGAYLGFLPWNWYPQKIMPGYGGKSLAGYLLGVMAIMASGKVGAMVMVLGIPIIDALIVVVKRISEGRSPVWGGFEHLHHLLLKRGWGKRRIAVFYWGASAILAIAALQLNSTQKWFTMAIITGVAGGGILWLHYFSIFLKQRDRDSG